jgi:hypothetical protein
MTDPLKDHLRQDHGIHEESEPVVSPDGAATAPSYGPDVSDERLEELHQQHHDENPELLRHSHDDGALG